MKRRGETLSVAQEVAVSTFGAMAIEPDWFELVDDVWEVDGDTVTATVQAYDAVGGLGQQYKVTMTVEEA